MSLFRLPEDSSQARMHAMEGLCPLRDPVFIHLCERALKGDVQVYYAAVPRTAVRRFGTKYDPRANAVGRNAVAQLMDSWRGGNFIPVWVYEQGDGFVLSDDYITWAAAEEGQPDFLPCWVLGKPTVPGVAGIQGPIAVAEVPKMLGLTSDGGQHA